MTVWAFYGRVSSDEQAGNNSLPTQQEAAHAKAGGLGATHVIDFIDAGVPGDLNWTDRPALSQLLEMVEEDRLAGVVVYDPDRLARDLGVQLAVTEILMRHNVRLEFCTQEFNASPEGMLFYQMRGAISQFERAKIRERTQRGRKKALRSGRPTNKVTTYGIEYDRASNTWRINEEQAEVVRQIFAWCADGIGPTAIAARLNAAGVTPPRGGDRWWMTVIQRILRNESYLGTFHLHRYNLEGVRKNKFLPPERRVRREIRPATDWVPVKIPATITREAWDAAHERLEGNQKRWAGRQAARIYLGSRVLRCGCCGSPLHGVRNSTGQPYYRCGGRYGELRRQCEMPYLPADEIDALVWDAVRARLLNPEIHQRSVQQLLATKAKALPAGDVDAKIRAVREDLARLERLISDGLVKESEVRPALRGLREKEAALARAAATPELPNPTTFEAMSPEEVDALSAAERQARVRALLSAVVVHLDGRLELTPHIKVRL